MNYREELRRSFIHLHLQKDGLFQWFSITVTENALFFQNISVVLLAPKVFRIWTMGAGYPAAFLFWLLNTIHLWSAIKSLWLVEVLSVHDVASASSCMTMRDLWSLRVDNRVAPVSFGYSVGITARVLPVPGSDGSSGDRFFLCWSTVLRKRYGSSSGVCSWEEGPGGSCSAFAGSSENHSDGSSSWFQFSSQWLLPIGGWLCHRPFLEHTNSDLQHHTHHIIFTRLKSFTPQNWGPYKVTALDKHCKGNLVLQSFFLGTREREQWFAHSF